jgi:hypothetical protein
MYEKFAPCFLVSLFQLRYLQTLNNISAEKNSTIVFPVPIDILSHFMGRAPRLAELH